MDERDDVVERDSDSANELGAVAGDIESGEDRFNYTRAAEYIRLRTRIRTATINRSERRTHLFGEEEFNRYHNPQRKVKGFSFIPVEELDEMSMNWPDIGQFTSENPFFLRGLAVTYFYQSQMLKARELLLKVWEMDFRDLDISLMLAECACALPDAGNETFQRALQRVCDYAIGNFKFTQGLVTTWETELVEKGRFMGYIILQYALYQKLNDQPERVKSYKDLTFLTVKKICRCLSRVGEEEFVISTPLSSAIQYLLERLKFAVDLFSVDETRKQNYVECFCINCLAWISLCQEDYQKGLELAKQGIRVALGKSGEGAKMRMLYGNLLVNKGGALFGLRRFAEAQREFKQAEAVYETYMHDHCLSIRKAHVISQAQEYAARSGRMAAGRR